MSQRRAFTFVELLITTTLILSLWIFSFSVHGPNLERAREVRTTLHREAARTAGFLAYHARHGEMPRTQAELSNHLLGAAAGQPPSFHSDFRVLEVLPDGEGRVFVKEVSR